jgi:hypothetical protein
MSLLHDPSVRESLERRLKQLRPDAKPAWGKMSADQMLWHVNQGLATAVGSLTPTVDKAPLPRPIMRWIVLNLPWPKNSPTNPAFVARQQYDFETERARCLSLVAECVAQPLEAPQPVHPMFGRMTGRDQSRLQAKHLDYHLRQFGV